MLTHRLLTTAAALAIGLAAPQLAAAQAQGAKPAAAQAQTQSAAAQATGKATTDTPAASNTQGTAWAVQQGAASNPGAAASATPSRPTAAQVVPHGDLIETAKASGQFTTFLKAADATNLTAVLKTNQNLTVFAPTDAAFAALPPGQLDRLMADKPALQKLLTHHIINARVDSTKIKGAKGPVPSVAGDQVQLDGSGPMLKADNADIVQSDVMASNGVLHVVDRVLTPGVPAAPMAAAATGAVAPASTTTTTTTSTTPAATAPESPKPRGK
ncbi:hypothetical protein DJ021_16925 [Phenylobacterium hankyongense]|uniref:FAS1 domain-containing protein n=1 Tax=Phenylobacterium hankyongense TaxID=1813876 RepID=A0A328B600_9CAUL|nr:fasciclin domain-containing protein [Phenylobacterium hankyongense]RAK61366.1 hypothetical protein DJ021_16925 [Phenylobacterium hankyongense]